ncbi:MAG: hypothetical protein ACRC0L_08525, partial [Angustibacter sp.]
MPLMPETSADAMWAVGADPLVPLELAVIAGMLLPLVVAELLAVEPSGRASRPDPAATSGRSAGPRAGLSAELEAEPSAVGLGASSAAMPNWKESRRRVGGIPDGASVRI